MKNKREKAGTIIAVAGIVFFGVAFICSCIFLKSAMDHLQGKKEYDSVRERATQADGQETDSAAEGDTSEDKKDDRLVINWDAMLAENSDYVGWLEMAPNISYPVVRGTDVKFYLNKGFYKEYNINGSIFMHCDCDPGWTSRNTVLYGHNMIDGSMFGSLQKYGNEDFLSSNGYIFIHVKGGRRIYKIFDCIYAEDTSEPYNVAILTDEEMALFLQDMKRRSHIWTEGNAPVPTDTILTLSTCVGNVGSSRRQLVQAKYVGFEPY